MAGEIIIPPHPLIATCPQCGMMRSLPEGWEQILRATAEQSWDGVLRCLNDHPPVAMNTQYRDEQFLLVTEGGPHPANFVTPSNDDPNFTGFTAAGYTTWPLPDELPDEGGKYVKVSQSELPPMPPDSHVLRGAKYKWVPADAS